MSNLWGLVIAYLLGTLPTGYLLVKRFQGKDIREFGSGNIGATNVVRAMGPRFGIVVLAIDAAKGFLAVWIAGQISPGSQLWLSAAAVAVMLGNAFPVFLGFRGGKTFATAFGAFSCLAPAAVAAEIPVFFGTALITRHISAGSIVVAITFPLAVWMIIHPGLAVVSAAVAAGALLLWRHRDNIRRLHEGAEHRFEWRKR